MNIHFIDVGANRGESFECFLAKSTVFQNAHVHLIEPSPRHLTALMATVERYAAKYHCHVYPFGLGGRGDVARFYLKDDPRGDSFAETHTSDHTPANLPLRYTLHAATVSAVDFIEAHTAPGDSITLKIDAEGSEFAILTDLLSSPATLARVSTILVEWHHIPPTDRTYSREALTTIFKAAGRPLLSWEF